jgi:hypothetical protein
VEEQDSSQETGTGREFISPDPWQRERQSQSDSPHGRSPAPHIPVVMRLVCCQAGPLSNMEHTDQSVADKLSFRSSFRPVPSRPRISSIYQSKFESMFEVYTVLYNRIV